MPGVGRGGMAYDPYKDMTREQLEEHARSSDKTVADLKVEVADLKKRLAHHRQRRSTRPYYGS